MPISYPFHTHLMPSSYPSQLGHGGGANVETPRVIAALRHERIIQIAAGAQHCLALAERGSSSSSHTDVDSDSSPSSSGGGGGGGLVYSWGYNHYGQLGHGHTRTLATPAPIEHLRGVRVEQIAAGGSHSLAAAAAFKGAGDMIAVLEHAAGWHPLARAAARRSVQRQSGAVCLRFVTVFYFKQCEKPCLNTYSRPSMFILSSLIIRRRRAAGAISARDGCDAADRVVCFVGR